MDANLSATLLFNYPTVEALARYLSENVFLPRVGEPDGSEEVAKRRTELNRRAAEEEQIQDVSQTELEAMLDEELASLDELLGS